MIHPSAADDWEALGVVSAGEYGIPEGLFFGFPVRSDGERVHVVEGLDVPEPLAARIAVTRDELIAERAEIGDLLPSH